MASLSYSARLKAAITRAEKSVRQVAKELAERTGNSPEDERSAVYKYRKDREPTPERAALLADILNEPSLRTVTPLAEKRSGRQAELEAEVAQLREEFDAFVRAATERMARLEATETTPKQQSGRASNNNH